MRKICFACVLAVLFSTASFADSTSWADSKDQSCGQIANACKQAGFKGRKFWQDCMRPLVLGQTVKGVTIDSSTVKACQTAKIEELKNELNDIEKAIQK